MTATSVASKRPSGPNRFTACRVFTIQPSSARISFHDSVRSRKLVKNGAMTRISIRFFQRPDLNAIAYANT
jgi:hypothetical protein